MMQKTLTMMPEKKFTYFSVPVVFISLALYANAFYHPAAATAASFAYILLYLVSSGFAVPREMGKYLPIPLLLFTIGISGSGNHSFYDSFKDAWYYLNPPIILCAGYLAMNRIKRIEPVLNTFIAGGLILSVYYLFDLLSDIPFLLSASVNELHMRKGGGHFLTVVSLAIFLIARRRGILLFNGRFNEKTIPLMIIVNGAAVFLSFYRAMWLSVIILVLFGGGFFTLRKLFRGLAAVGIIIALFQSAVILVPGEQLDPSTILGKIALSLDEVIIRDYSRIADMQAHWRGYESYMAFQSYIEGTLLNVFAGHGFGKLVDLKIVMLLGSETMRYIPVLHNGYMYLLVKTGLLGLVLHLAYLYILIQAGTDYINDTDNRVILAGYFIMASAMVFLITTFFTAGMFNKNMFFSLILLLGCLLSFARIRKVELGGSVAI